MRFEDTKRKICTKKDIKFLTGILAASLLLGGCTGKTPSGKPLTDDPSIKAEIDLSKVKKTEYDSSLMDSEYKRYTFALLSQTIKDFGGDDNVMVSPASIMIALDMVAAGAKKDSLRQLTDLFAEGQDPIAQQAYAAALMDKINNAKEIDFSCANAVWNNGALLGDNVNMDYVKYIRETFLAEYTVTDFNEKTPSEINSWVDKKTNHMIPEIIDELKPRTVMVLVNAISFDAKWEDRYDNSQIRDGEFRRSDGSTQEVVFLNDKFNVYYESDKATAFKKMYTGGQYAFLAILPKDESISANEFAKNFTYEDYKALVEDGVQSGLTVTKMPEFKSDFSFLANDTLMNLGVTDIFEEGKADLSGISSKPGDLYVSRVIHKTHIEVDNIGTKASAATAVTVRNKGETIESVSKEIFCDRPYVYAIVDVKTMTPVFIGTVNQV